MTLCDGLGEWAGLMKRHTPQARQVLRKLLHGRVIVQQTPEREDCYAEITATATIGKVLTGTVVVPKVLASPTGLNMSDRVGGLLRRAA